MAETEANGPVRELKLGPCEAIKLDKGDVVILRVPEAMPTEQCEALAASCEMISEDIGVRFIAIPDSLQVSVLKRALDGKDKPLIHRI